MADRNKHRGGQTLSVKVKSKYVPGGAYCTKGGLYTIDIEFVYYNMVVESESFKGYYSKIKFLNKNDSLVNIVINNKIFNLFIFIYIMGKLLSRLICYSEAEQRQRRPERQSQETIILKTTREPVVYRDSFVVKTNSESQREELSTAIKYFIFKSQ
jgi:hypothetical protein